MISLYLIPYPSFLSFSFFLFFSSFLFLFFSFSFSSFSFFFCVVRSILHQTAVANQINISDIFSFFLIYRCLHLSSSHFFSFFFLLFLFLLFPFFLSFSFSFCIIRSILLQTAVTNQTKSYSWV